MSHPNPTQDPNEIMYPEDKPEELDFDEEEEEEDWDPEREQERGEWMYDNYIERNERSDHAHFQD